MPASRPLSPATAATLVAQSSALLKVQMAIAAGRIVGGRGCRPLQIGDRQRPADGRALHPQRAAVDVLVEPGRQHRGAGAVDLRAVDGPGAAVDVRPAQQHPRRRRCVEHQLQLDLADGGPALEIARRQPAEVGVGVDGRTLFQVQRVALPMRPAVDDARVHVVGHLRARAGEQAARHDQPLGCGVLGERLLQRVGGRVARRAAPRSVMLLLLREDRVWALRSFQGPRRSLTSWCSKTS